MGRFMMHYMMNGLMVMLIINSVFLLGACANKAPVEEEKEVEVQPDKMVARVASVHKEAKYVLIQRFGRLVIPEDSILYTLGSNTVDVNKAGSIQLTGEKLGQFLAADIMSGDLMIGDAVYLRIFDKNDDSDSQ